MQAKLLYEIPCELGEGPMWHVARKQFFWVDILNCQLHSLCPETGRHRMWEMPARVSAVVPDAGGQLILGLQNYVSRFNPDTGESERLLDLPEPGDNRSNDAKCDPAGRLWLGTMNMRELPGAGSVYGIEPDGEISVKITGTTISNGMAWTKDRQTMYFIDSPTRCIRQFDYDEATGEISLVKNAVEIPEEAGTPDGMAIDEHDRLWVAHYDGAGIYHWDPRDGKLLGKIEVPAPHVTSCAFGGDALDELYITTARDGLTAEEKEKFPHSGSVFVARPGVRGWAPDVFGG